MDETAVAAAWGVYYRPGMSSEEAQAFKAGWAAAKEQTPDKPKYKFTLRYTHRPNDPYYVTNWDHGSTIDIVATDREEAFRMADEALGSAGSHRHWVFLVLGIEQV